MLVLADCRLDVPYKIDNELIDKNQTSLYFVKLQTHISTLSILIIKQKTTLL